MGLDAFLGKIDVGFEMGDHADEWRAGFLRSRAPSGPSSCSSAACRARGVLARMTSITASAWVRSILPLRKARRVNSPGSAARAPAGEEGFQQVRGAHKHAAVAVNLRHVLAGVAAGGGKESEQAFVEALTVFCEDPEMQRPRRESRGRSGRFVAPARDRVRPRTRMVATAPSVRAARRWRRWCRRRARHREGH